MNTEQINIVYQKEDCDLDMEILHPSRVYDLKAKAVKIIGTEIARDHTVSNEFRIYVYVSNFHHVPSTTLTFRPRTKLSSRTRLDILCNYAKGKNFYAK